jgi:hypothetical protein
MRVVPSTRNSHRSTIHPHHHHHHHTHTCTHTYIYTHFLGNNIRQKAEFLAFRKQTSVAHLPNGILKNTRSIIFLFCCLTVQKTCTRYTPHFPVNTLDLSRTPPPFPTFRSTQIPLCICNNVCHYTDNMRLVLNFYWNVCITG